MNLGVCSWSLNPSSPQDLVDKVLATGVGAVQLALDPLRQQWEVADTVGLLKEANIQILSGMMMMSGEDYSTFETIRTTGGVRPDSTWQENLQAAEEIATIASSLDIDLVTFHGGFIPHDPEDPERAQMLDRLKKLASVFHQHGCRVALETGQESATTLSDVLVELNTSTIGVNFDPANMILYGMGDPIEALDLLAPSIFQLHIKDALPSQQPGQWGSEEPVGDGAVQWERFFQIIEKHDLDMDLVIEREAGEQRVADVIQARKLIETHREPSGRTSP